MSDVAINGLIEGVSYSIGLCACTKSISKEDQHYLFSVGTSLSCEPETRALLKTLKDLICQI